ncbi:MAG: peptide deformylase [Candidatus Pacebacteria bacterium RIFCSPHIGHO2_01_FULL_46_16]|nr:MAG: peptide deformylase [Candidatus Pacebacteria bacterium RIFCSPHIGHO2_01_FULL_46_16]OGJ38721.1 MAG: peptide deformylase [Candidatus Pacebacteria bacterium RIFCSPLOWO2_01_FULL_47_12]
MTSRPKIATIIHLPHPALRAVAQPITVVDTRLLELNTILAASLQQTHNPRGVGLAAPQIAVSKRLFATQLEQEIRLYINPNIVAHSERVVMGPPGEEPRLEGCLSIPKIYGPVPRWEWVELEYDAITGEKLTRKKARLSDFPARVVQHELDHLNGKLFIDYSLTFELPIYSENPATEELELLAPDLLVALGAQPL